MLNCVGLLLVLNDSSYKRRKITIFNKAKINRIKSFAQLMLMLYTKRARHEILINIYKKYFE